MTSYRERRTGHTVGAVWNGPEIGLVTDARGVRQVVAPRIWIVYAAEGYPLFTIEDDDFRARYEKVDEGLK